MNAAHPTPRRECLYDAASAGCTRGGCQHHLKPCPFPSEAEKRERCTHWRDPVDSWEARRPVPSCPTAPRDQTARASEAQSGPERRFSVTLLPAGFGDQRSQTRCELICPFCAATIIAYRWSLAGSGKRCACGVLLCSGIAFDTRGVHGPVWSMSEALDEVLGKARE